MGGVIVSTQEFCGQLQRLLGSEGSGLSPGRTGEPRRLRATKNSCTRSPRTISFLLVIPSSQSGEHRAPSRGRLRGRSSS